jgi:hypothetical protein
MKLMNTETEQDVVKPLSSVDTEIKASRQKLDEDFKEFCREKDAEDAEPKPLRESEPAPEAAATAVPKDILAERDRLRSENERLKKIEMEVDITSDPDFQKQFTIPFVDT